MASVEELKQALLRMMNENERQQAQLSQLIEEANNRKRLTVAMFAGASNSNEYARIRGGQDDTEVRGHDLRRALKVEHSGLAAYLIRLG